MASILELLAQQQPRGSGFIAAAQNRKARTLEQQRISAVAADTRCLSCKGRKFHVGEFCEACWGGKQRRATRAAETRSRTVPAIDGPAVSFLLSGLSESRVLAARAATGDLTDEPRLIQLFWQDMTPLITDWLSKLKTTTERNDCLNRAFELCRLTVRELSTPGLKVKESVRYKRVGVSKTSWFRVWRARHQQLVANLHGWVDQAVVHMKRRIR